MGWIILFIITLLSPNPPEPKAKYGEFPFLLEYEIDGERKIIKDALVCEYNGIEIAQIGEKRRRWKGHLKSGNEKIILVQVSASEYLYYFPGEPEYYMGDSCLQNFNEGGFFRKDCIRNNSNPLGSFVLRKIIYEDELLEKYKIKLIRWERSSPIVNEFN